MISNKFFSNSCILYTAGTLKVPFFVNASCCNLKSITTYSAVLSTWSEERSLCSIDTFFSASSTSIDSPSYVSYSVGVVVDLLESV